MYPVSPPARAYERLVGELAREVGPGAAVSWAHVVALADHCEEHGLIEHPEPPAGPDRTLRTLATLAEAHPALQDLADPKVVKAWENPLSLAGWRRAARFWDQVPLVDDGHLVQGYRLGDAYQAVSAEARASRALCQTPPWVAQLLLELSLEPATDEVGPDSVRMIDPSCGTGHILLSSFHYLRCHRPRGRGPRASVSLEQSVERALRAVCGVDLDAYAAALARYRLLASAAHLLSVRIDEVPSSWPVQVAAADALLDTDEPLLRRGAYDAVVGNPPYITARDPQVREWVRRRYPEVCSGKFSLALPFTVLMTQLAKPAGRIAQLTANSFMKREFGDKYVEQYLPTLDLTWVIDTSGCYIPGHGTPTVILAHRARPPHSDTVHVVRGIRGEPRIPEDPSEGLVWAAVADAVRGQLAFERLRLGFQADLQE
jgi:hypothetical protein